MFEEKVLFRFTPFYFKDGGGSKPKYFIVLKVVGDTAVVACLPTSVNHIPFGNENVVNGCIDLPGLDFKCYCFLQNTAVTDTAFCFPLNTFVYGRGVDDYSLETLSITYRVEHEDYERCGKLTDEIYYDLLLCLKDSSNIRRKFRRMIESWLP